MKEEDPPFTPGSQEVRIDHTGGALPITRMSLLSQESQGYNPAMKRYILFLILSACGAGHAPLPPPEATPKFVQLYMTRASFSRAEFEQYKVSPAGIFVECGSYSRGRQIPEHQTFSPLAEEGKGELDSLASELSALLASDTPQLEAPGKSDGMFDPGQFSLSIETDGGRRDLRTSVNAIVNKGGVIERKAHRLAQMIRAASGDSFCGKTDFYGLTVISKES